MSSQSLPLEESTTHHEIVSKNLLLNLPSGVHLPAVEYSHPLDDPRQERKDLHLILCHGLGAKNPKHKDHSSDDWIPIAAMAALPLIQSSVLFTSRGHRGTTGWEESAESDLEQFTWRRLAQDMMAVADQVVSTSSEEQQTVRDNNNKKKKVIVGGSSMGSAAAFYSALQYPEQVAAVIMIRPPTGWEDRLARRSILLGSAKRCEEKNDVGDKYHLVLQGTALSDFPPLEELEVYRKIQCPVLILAVEGDETHPLDTAQRLVDRLPHAKLFISQNLEEARKMWPKQITDFIAQL